MIGDLVRSPPLPYWSVISLMIWDMPEDRCAVYIALHTVSREPRINLIDAATRSQRDMIAHEAIFLTDNSG